MVAIPGPFHSLGSEQQRLVQRWFESKFDSVHACLCSAIPPTGHHRFEVSARQIEVSENETRREGWFYHVNTKSCKIQDEMLSKKQMKPGSIPARDLVWTRNSPEALRLPQPVPADMSCAQMWTVFLAPEAALHLLPEIPVTSINKTPFKYGMYTCIEITSYNQS